MAGTTVRFKEAFVALLIGMFVNNVLPARLGEVARGYVLSRKKKLSFTYSLSTVFLDRFFDLTGLLLIVLIALIFIPRASLPPVVSKGIYFVIGVLLICIIFIIVLSGRASPTASPKSSSPSRDPSFPASSGGFSRCRKT